MNWSISFEPLLAWPLSLAILVRGDDLGSGRAVVSPARRAVSPARLCAALALALLNPVMRDEQREPLKSVVALVVDRSQSQDIAGRADQTTQAVQGLEQRLARFKQFEVRVVEAGKSRCRRRARRDALFSALDGALRDVPPSRIGGAIMITDGQVHDVPALRGAAGAPLHALITGNDGEEDRRIRFENAPRFGIVGKPLDIDLPRHRRRRRDRPGRCARVDQWRAGRRSSTPPIGQEMPARHRPSPAPAATSSNSPSTAMPGELTDTNNRAIALIDGIRENLRVLLVSGEPHAGERTWRNLLKSDASVDLVHFTILRPPEKQDGTPINELSLIAFPTRELFVEKINDFDLIIFDRYQHRDVLPILYYDYIAEYVEKGGALLIAAGPEYAGEQLDRAHAADVGACRRCRPARSSRRPSIRGSPTSASAIR